MPRFFVVSLQDNFLKAQDAEPKPKKPRKKTKPSALTRPPKKGKKKKNQRKNVRPQNQVPVQDTAADTGEIDLQTCIYSVCIGVSL